MSIYYYCKGYKLLKYLKQAYIPTNDIDESIGVNVPPTLVCTTDTNWDYLEKGQVNERVLSIKPENEEIAKLFGGMFRIEISEKEDFLLWAEWVKLSGITRKESQELYRYIGIDKKSREKLRMTFKSIPIKNCLAIYQWECSSWKKWSGNKSELLASGIVLDDL